MTSNILQVPDKNIQFAKKFLADEKIPIVSEDVGGSWPRKVFFFNTENRVLMKKLEGKTKEFSAEQEINAKVDIVPFLESAQGQMAYQLSKLPNITAPIRGAASGKSKATSIITLRGKIIFSLLLTGRNCFISIFLSFSVVSHFIIGG